MRCQDASKKDEQECFHRLVGGFVWLGSLDGDCMADRRRNWGIEWALWLGFFVVVLTCALAAPSRATAGATEFLIHVERESETNILHITVSEVETAHPAIIVTLIFVFCAIGAAIS